MSTSRPAKIQRPSTRARWSRARHTRRQPSSGFPSSTRPRRCRSSSATGSNLTLARRQPIESRDFATQETNVNMPATTLDRIAEQAPTMTEAQRNWRIAAIALLSIRVIQGFIYWGGGSRRFIYAPSKLDPSAHSWMAKKFQTAMPGALLGTDHLISFLLTHFYLLYAGVILFSAAELIVGAMLMTGLLTRLAALFSMGFSVLLMVMFGWQGATCIDEWTMAACNLAMGASLLLAGSGAYSLDNVLLHRNPALAGKQWFRWASGSLPLPQTDGGFRTLA